LKKNIENISIA